VVEVLGLLSWNKLLYGHFASWIPICGLNENC
jgi:hypothetical protein